MQNTPAKTKKTSKKVSTKKILKKPSTSNLSIKNRPLAKPLSSQTSTQVKQVTRHHARTTFEVLSQTYPNAHCELNYQSAFQLLVAVILSAQATDVSVNKVTPTFFARFGDAYALASARIEDVTSLISTVNMHTQKAHRVIAMARLLVEKHQGQVPNTLEQLVALPGVGRKTANVVLAEWFKNPIGIVVDTHVQRLSQRLGWTQQTSPEKIEHELLEMFPQKDWAQLAHVLIFHGRRTCKAVKPACDSCTIASRCSVAGNASNVGRKILASSKEKRRLSS